MSNSNAREENRAAWAEMYFRLDLYNGCDENRLAELPQLVHGCIGMYVT